MTQRTWHIGVWSLLGLAGLGLAGQWISSAEGQAKSNDAALERTRAQAKMLDDLLKDVLGSAVGGGSTTQAPQQQSVPSGGSIITDILGGLLGGGRR